MIVYPNAKINLGLQITGRRPDGYHLLSSVFLPIALRDILEVVIAEGASDSLTVYGAVETGRIEDNLVLRAVRALRQHCDLPPLDLYLYKQIPSGAGMGGGSADATFALRAVRELLDLPLDDDLLRQIAATLGADCPFFVANEPALTSGIGEIFSAAPELPLSGLEIVVVKPPLHISTAEAFGGLRQIGGHTATLMDLLSLPIEMWRDRVVNDFEASLFPRHRELPELKQWLYDQGALYASMTGSGAALYGFFRAGVDIRLLRTSLPESVFLWRGKL